MHMRISISVLATALLFASCTAPTKPDDDAAPAEVVDGSTASGAEGTTYGLDDTDNVSGEGLGSTNLHEPENNGSTDLLSQRSIYFEYDSDLISAIYRTVFEAHSRIVNTRANLQISLEGHADERGAREYNLALGEKRALAVGKLFMLLGLSQNRINTLSYGEERPHATGSDEASWHLNRRVDLVY